MFNVKCNKCDIGVLFMDERTTFNAYKKNIDYINQSVDEIASKAVGSYLYYKCNYCNSTVKMTYEELEKEIRKSIINNVLEYRKSEVMAKLGPTFNKNIDEANGVSYCGICLGVDGEGWCYNDMIEICPLRKETK